MFNLPRKNFGFPTRWQVFLLALLVNLSWLISNSVLAEERKRDISFSWEPIQGATGYDLEFSRNIKQSFVVIQPLATADVPSWTGSLEPGFYRFRLRARDKRGVPGQWSEPSDLPIRHFAVEVKLPVSGKEVLTKQEEVYKLKAAWEKMNGVKVYKFAVLDAKGQVVKSSESTTTSAIVELPVAASYKLQVQAFSERGEGGDKMESPVEFTLIGKKLARPVAEIKPAEIEDEATWSKPKYTESFKVVASYAAPSQGGGKKKLKKAERQWQPLFESANYLETDFQLKDRPFGFYRLEIVAQGKLRLPSAPLTMEFEYKDPDAGKDKSKVQPQYSGAVAYTYLPSLQTFSLNSVSTQTKLNILMLNSHRISASYWLFGGWLGFEGGAIQRYSELFGKNSRVSGPEGQKPIQLSYANFDLLTRMRLDFGFLGIEAIAGMTRNGFYSFLREPDNTVAAERGTLLFANYGARLYFRIGDTTSGIQVMLAPLISADGFQMLSAAHSVYNLDMAQTVFTESVLMNFGLSASKEEYKFTSAALAEERTVSMNLITFIAGLSWRY